MQFSRKPFPWLFSIASSIHGFNSVLGSDVIAVRNRFVSHPLGSFGQSIIPKYDTNNNNHDDKDTAFAFSTSSCSRMDSTTALVTSHRSKIAATCAHHINCSPRKEEKAQKRWRWRIWRLQCNPAERFPLCRHSPPWPSVPPTRCYGRRHSATGLCSFGSTQKPHRQTAIAMDD